MEEIWKEVQDPAMKDVILVSNLGNAWRTDLEKPARVHDNGNGYKAVHLWYQGKQRMRYLHRLVAQAFLDNPEGLPQVGHKDDDKSNNAAENLYWCSNSQNIRDAHKTGRMKKRSEYGTTGRYTESIVGDAYVSVKRGAGIAETAKRLGLPRTTVSSYMNKRSWVEFTDFLDELLETP